MIFPLSPPAARPFSPPPIDVSPAAGRESRAVIGWRDEFDDPDPWILLGGNRAIATMPATGLLRLELGHVPAGWPYQYQWSGVQREAEIDLWRTPVFLARLESVHGYAHLDVEILGPKGDVVRGVRSSTVTAAGLVRADLSPGESKKRARAGKTRVRIRLIVGGPNEGCAATYDWIRAVDARTGANASPPSMGKELRAKELPAKALPAKDLPGKIRFSFGDSQEYRRLSRGRTSISRRPVRP